MFTAIAVMMLVAIVLLAVPMTLIFRFQWLHTQEAARMVLEHEACLAWAFGLIKLRLDDERSPHRPGRLAEQTAAERPPRIGRVIGAAHRVFEVLHQRRFRRCLLRFAGRLWRAVDKHEVVVRFRLGLGDPADTGQLWGALGPVCALLSTRSDASIVIEPEFEQATLDLAGCGQLRIIPLQLISLAFLLLLSPTFWLGCRALKAA